MDEEEVLDALQVARRCLRVSGSPNVSCDMAADTACLPPLTCVSNVQLFVLFPPPFQISILICLAVRASRRNVLATEGFIVVDGKPLVLPPRYLMTDDVLKTDVATKRASSP